MSADLSSRAEGLRRILTLTADRGRTALLRARGARLGKKVLFGRQCRVERPFRLTVGDRCTIEDRVFIKIVSDKAIVEIGEHTFLGAGVELDVAEEVRIGAHTLIAPGCFVTDHNHGVKADLRIDEQECTRGRVSIGDDVWLGAKVVVLPGVSIGDGAVVGASSVVTRSVPPMTIVAGSPAAPIGSRE